MSLIEKLEPLLLAVAALVGLALGHFTSLSGLLGPWVQILLILMLIGVFWDIPFSDLRKGFSDIKFSSTSLAINFIWIPILGYILAKIFLSSSADLQIGYLMLLVTPCTDWYLVFTAMARGNVPLSASILPLNLIVQLLLLPVYLWIFGGLSGQSDPFLILWQVVLVLFIPLLAARLLTRLSQKKLLLSGAFRGIFPGLRFWYLFLAVLCMFASEGGTIIKRPDIFLLLLAPVLLFFLLNFIIVRVIASLMRFNFQDSVSLNLTTLARNSPVALTVAIGAFPDQPLIALALIIGPLIELPVLALIAHLLLYLGRKKGHLT
ncbi:MAG: bile acid:sodium symporter [Deltaproteobacteria bacterium]|nr:bile acid:sodium symporter [Deltaproteobacteria bacterium]